jgi:hypothetical protein
MGCYFNGIYWFYNFGWLFKKLAGHNTIKESCTIGIHA